MFDNVSPLSFFFAAKLPNWKVVVVGDQQSPKDCFSPGVVFLSVDAQAEVASCLFIS
jgi:hypothetical protein